MDRNQELIKEFETEFAKLKKELGFKATLDELDSAFFIRDAVLTDGFVSNNLSRQVFSRITNTYMNWNNYLHGLVFMNPGNMMLMTESRMFKDDEKKKINTLISNAMGFVSANTLVGLMKDKKKEAKLIDDSMEFWNKTFRPEIEKIMKRISDGWMKKD